MTNQDQRFNRISLILDAVKQVEEKKGVGTNKESLINYFSDYFKLSKVKVREYVKELIEKGKVEERGSELFISTGNNTDFQEVLGL